MLMRLTRNVVIVAVLFAAFCCELQVPANVRCLFLYLLTMLTETSLLVASVLCIANGTPPLSEPMPI